MEWLEELTGMGHTETFSGVNIFCILFLVLFKCIYNSGTPKVLHSIAGNYTSIKYFKNHIKFDFSGILPPKS